MKNKKCKSFFTKTSSFLLFVSLLVALCGCGRTQTRRATYYGLFDTPRSYVDDSAESAAVFAARIERADAALTELNELFDIYHEYEGKNNLASLNRMAGQGPVALDARLIDLLSLGKRLCALTDGKINIMMGSVLSLWHDLREEGLRLPTDGELAARAAHCSIDSLVLDPAAGTAEITDPLASVDVGAIAKGYACGYAAGLLRAEGTSSFVVDIGGNLCALGGKASGDPWNTAIRNPDEAAEEPYAAYFPLSDGCLSTSGGYERYFVVDGVRYHHLIDPETLYPAGEYGSVSVYCAFSDEAAPAVVGALADGLSSALFLMDRAAGEACLARVRAAFGLARTETVYL